MAKGASPTYKDLLKGLFAIAGVAVIAAIAFGVFVRVAGDGLATLFKTTSSLDTAVIVALITGLVSIVTVVLGGVVSNAQRELHYLRQHREQPYQKLIEMVYKMMAKSKSSTPYGEEEMLSDFTEFSQALTLWGSAKAINMWAEWRLLSVEGKSKPDPHELLFAMEGIMIQLRRDMGQKRGLKKGDLLRLFINDVDEKLL